jgi:hypothetical protein
VSVYRGARVAFLTQHGKEAEVAPVLRAALGVHVERAEGVDTDTLGTFTRDVPRAGSQLDAARTKARLACERSGLPLGLGSEGAFGADPTGTIPWDVELLVWVDRARDLEIVGRAHGPAAHAHAHVGSAEELEAFARAAGFPEHALVLRPDRPDHPRIHKGVTGWGALRAALDDALARASTGLAFVENDLRAHVNPTRRKVIRAAAEDLAQRAATLCPACRGPGFGLAERVAGAPCPECGLPTAIPRAERWTCPGCAHREDRPLAAIGDPAWCPACNP